MVSTDLALAVCLAPIFVVYLVACMMSPILRFGRVRRGSGLSLFIVRDAIHADYLFESSEWSGVFDARGRYLKVGWGDKKIFLETRTWGDLRVRDVASAFFGLNPTVLRVEHVDEVPKGSKRIDIDPAQMDAIKDHVLRSFRGKPIGRRSEDYQGGDFYESDLSYNCVTNCNNWVNGGMFLAGVTNRVWCPLSLWL